MQNQQIEKAIYIDVREKSERDQGHISGAIHIPLLSILLGDISKIPKDHDVYIYCRSGSRSGIATGYLKMKGYTNVSNIGGISQIEGQTIIR